MGERERVALLERVLSRLGDDDGSIAAVVRVGIGDDAAVVESAGPLVCSVDAVVENIHFVRAWLGLDELGYKATMAALSDLAAMGARPIGVLSALVLPREIEDDELEAIARGQAEACHELGTQVIGGNLSRGGELSITTTALGSAGHTLRREDAQPGDDLLLAGAVGLAAAGLRALQQGREADPDVALAVVSWRRPRALIEEGLRAASVAHGAIDLSDGLALDAGRMAQASGLTVVLELEQIVGSSLRRAAAALDADPEDLALHGGEDYALLVSAPAGTEIEGFARIGSCEAGEPQVVLEHDGQRRPVEVRGYDHFSSPPGAARVG